MPIESTRKKVSDELHIAAIIMHALYGKNKTGGHTRSQLKEIFKSKNFDIEESQIKAVINRLYKYGILNETVQLYAADGSEAKTVSWSLCFG